MINIRMDECDNISMHGCVIHDFVSFFEWSIAIDTAYYNNSGSIHDSHPRKSKKSIQNQEQAINTQFGECTEMNDTQNVGIFQSPNQLLLMINDG